MKKFISLKTLPHLFILIVAFIAFEIQATIFQKMPLTKLVEESSSGAEVTLKEKKSSMNKLGVIMTDYFFQVDESHQLDNSDLTGNYLKISLIGGTVDTVTSFVDGGPEFNIGEKSFLLLKKIDSKIYLSNFTMGKYKIENRDGKIFYISTVFPEDGEIGQVAKEKMIELLNLKEIKKESNGSEKVEFGEELKSKVVFIPREQERNPAQSNLSNENQQTGGAIAMWGFLALFLFSGLVIWWKLRQGVCE